MKKSLRNTLAIAGGVFGLLVLTGCNSFCSVTDNSNFRYGYDPINTTFYESSDDALNKIVTSFQESSGLSDEEFDQGELVFVYDNEENDSVKFSEDEALFKEKMFHVYNDNLVSVNAGQLEYTIRNTEDESTQTYVAYVGLNSFVTSLLNQAANFNYVLPAYSFYNELDQKTLEAVVDAANAQQTVINKTINDDFSNLTFEDLYGYTYQDFKTYNSLEDGAEKEELLDKMQKEREEGSILANYGYLKHYRSVTDAEGNDTVDFFINIKEWNNEIADKIGNDKVMTNNFMNYYQTQLQTRVQNAVSCITVEDGFYGNVSSDPLNQTVKIEGKSLDFYQGWANAFTEHGFLEGLLVYPIAIGVENLSHAFGMNGWGQIGAVLIMTIIIRFLFIAVTFPSTLNQQKMTYLQPEIQKLQQKYPNASTNQYDKQRLGQAQMALYKKNKVHPFLSMLIVVVQFPLFICVWNALQGSASLTTDAVLGLNLSSSIINTLTNFASWPSFAGWWTALVLIIILSALQIVSMLLPNILNKKRNKNVSKMVKNDAVAKQQSTMKWVQWIMCAFIVIMGFTLPAAMAVYWAAGAIFSICQTLILHFVFVKKGVK